MLFSLYFFLNPDITIRLPCLFIIISLLFSSVLFYDIIPLLSTRNPATGGGEPHGYYNLVSCLLYGKHNCLLCLQMARWRQVGQL